MAATRQVNEAVSQLCGPSSTRVLSDESEDAISWKRTAALGRSSPLRASQASHITTSSNDPSFPSGSAEPQDQRAETHGTWAATSTTSLVNFQGNDQTRNPPFLPYCSIEDTICTDQTPASSSDEPDPCLISNVSPHFEGMDTHGHDIGILMCPELPGDGLANIEGDLASFDMDVVGIGEQFAGYDR